VIRLADDMGLVWHAWDGEVVVFSEASGDTHRLDLLTSAVFEALLEGPLETSALARRIADELGTEPDESFSVSFETALAKMREIGLTAT